MPENAIEVIGWVGTILIIGAYFMVSFKKIGSDSKIYQLMNLFGAIGIGSNVFYAKAWPAVTMEAVWALIAVLALVNLSMKK